MKIVGLIIKYTWVALCSFIMNSYYRLKIGLLQISSYKCRLNIEINELTSKKDAAAFVNKHLSYKDDPLAGLFDWTCDPVILYARSRRGELTHSCDCDDYASLLAYVLKKMALYKKVKTRTVISRKPFITASHSFVSAIDVQGNIDVYSPYKYITAAKSEKEIIPILENYFKDVKFFDFII